MLPRRHRLSRPEDYRAVLRRGRPGHPGDVRRRQRAATKLLVVHAAIPAEPTPTRPTRVGFVVSKAVGNSVVRHRVIRRLRAQVADRLSLVPSGTDLVVRAAPAAATATSGQLGADLDLALQRVTR